MAHLDSIKDDFEDALLHVNRVQAEGILEQHFRNQGSFEQMEQIVMETLERIGSDWEAGLVSLSQVYMSGVICEDLVDKYLPKYQVRRINAPRMAIGVLLDHHALGKRIVYSVLRAAGFEILDFGQGLSVDELVHKTIENDIEVLLISTLMLPSALKVERLRDELRARGSFTKLVVGGAPFRLDPLLWRTVGADADGKSASHVIAAIEDLAKGGQ